MAPFQIAVVQMMLESRVLSWGGMKELRTQDACVHGMSH